MNNGSAKPSLVTTVREAWNRFFFSEDRPDALALVRACLCATVLAPVISRWPHARELYSTDGAPAPLSEWYPQSIDLPLVGGSAAVIGYTILVFCLLTALVGWKTRTSLAIAAPLFLYFGLIDAPGTLTKYTIIATHGLLILAVSNCGAAWSVDAWLKGNVAPPDKTPVWPTRLLQLFLAILYFATAITKVKTPEYMTGEHTLFWMQTDMNFAHPMGMWMSTKPALVVLSSYIVLLWEVLFCVLCWNRVLLKPLLAVGVLFHVMTYTLLGLPVFPFIILAFYPAFMSSDRARTVWMWLRRVTVGPRGLRPVGWAQYAWVFPLVLGLTVVTAVEAEYRLDPLGHRSPKPSLPKLDPAVAAELLQDTHPDRPGDWVWRFDVGSTTLAGVATGDVSEFQPYDAPILQIWSHKPHPDFYVHIDIVDEAEQVVMHDGVPIPRETLRATVPFSLAGNLRPGRYAFVLRDDVSMIARQEFTVVE